MRPDIRDDWQDQRKYPITLRHLDAAGMRTACGRKAYFWSNMLLIISWSKLVLAYKDSFKWFLVSKCAQVTGILLLGRISLWRDHWKKVFRSLLQLLLWDTLVMVWTARYVSSAPRTWKGGSKTQGQSGTWSGRCCLKSLPRCLGKKEAMGNVRNR